MGQSIGDLFVKLGFDVDETKLKSFDESIKSVFDNVLRLGGVAAGVTGFTLMMNQAANAATAVRNLNTEFGVSKQYAEGFRASYHAINPNSDSQEGLGVLQHIAEYRARMMRGQAGQEFGYFGGSFADDTPDKIFNRLRTGYAKALEFANGNKAIVTDWIRTITGSADMVNMITQSTEELQRSFARGVLTPEARKSLEDYNNSIADIANALDKLKSSWLSLPAKEISNFLNSPEAQAHPGGVVAGAGAATAGILGLGKYIGFQRLGIWAGVAAASYAAGNFGGEYLKSHGYELDPGHATYDGSNGNFWGIRKRNNSNAEAQLMGYGWDKAHASAILKRLMVESSMNPGAVGDNGQAYGLAQWHPDRQANFAKWAGHDIRGSSAEEQLNFLNWEMTKGLERSAGDKFRAARGEDAYDVFTKEYERPKQGDVTVTINNNFDNSANPEEHAGIVSRQVRQTIDSAFSQTDNGASR